MLTAHQLSYRIEYFNVILLRIINIIQTRVGDNIVFRTVNIYIYIECVMEFKITDIKIKKFNVCTRFSGVYKGGGGDKFLSIGRAIFRKRDRKKKKKKEKKLVLFVFQTQKIRQ